MERILTKINLLWAGTVTLMSSAFGVFWWAFGLFAILNVIDYGTGWYKARMYGKLNSMAGVKGLFKKLAYWITIFLAFSMSYAFTQLGAHIGVDFGFSAFIGWFVLITFLINEMRSILENLVECEVDLPKWLIKGLEVASDKINNAAGGDDSKEGGDNE